MKERVPTYLINYVALEAGRIGKIKASTKPCHQNDKVKACVELAFPHSLQHRLMGANTQISLLIWEINSC